ncbi:MAG: hypothetical protein IRY98_05700 [Alicyclobacillaceae bacterium]|nr:hypothetical protein [Alicyclobacillaceae bacterium]
MMDPKRIARMHDLQEEILRLRHAELEDALRVREGLRRSEDEWRQKASEAAGVRCSSSVEWTLWQRWAAYAEDRARQAAEAGRTAEEEVSARRRAVMEQWRQSRIWKNLRSKADQKALAGVRRVEEKQGEELVLARYALKEREGS